jgi:hypothetical protein
MRGFVALTGRGGPVRSREVIVLKSSFLNLWRLKTQHATNFISP